MPRMEFSSSSFCKGAVAVGLTMWRITIPVEWHGPTSTVYIGTIPHGAPFWTTVPFFERSGSAMTTRTVNVMGAPRAGAISTTGQGGWSRHNLNAQFNTLSGTIERIDGGTAETDMNNRSAYIRFVGDGRELGVFNVTAAGLPFDIEIDVTGILVLGIEISHPWLTWGGVTPVNPVFFDAMIK